MTSLDRIPQHEPFSFQAMQVVAAARRWAATIWETHEEKPVEFTDMDETPPLAITTREELALLNAVHDLEHRANPPRPAFPPLFEPPA